MALADNAGISGVDALAEAKSFQLSENNPALGIDCMNRGTSGKNSFLLFSLPKNAIILLFIHLLITSLFYQI